MFVGCSPNVVWIFWYFYLTDVTFWGLPYYDWWTADWISNHIMHSLILLPIFVEPMIDRNLPVKSTSNLSIILINVLGVGLICAYHQYFFLTAGYPVYPFEAKMDM